MWISATDLRRLGKDETETPTGASRNGSEERDAGNNIIPDTPWPGSQTNPGCRCPMSIYYLLRHAEAEMSSSSGKDQDRGLSDRGVSQCRALAGLFGRGELPRPATARVSPARRTLQTAERVLAGMDGTQIELDDRIWEAGVGDLIEVITDALGQPAPMMLVGHNPALEGLVRALSGQLQPMGTADLVVLELDGPPAPGKAQILGAY